MKTVFNLEDMIAFGKKCFYKGFDKSENDDSNCYTAWREENSGLVQSLSTQRLPKEFIPILESYCKCRERGYKCGSLKPETDAYCIQKLKTITNSEGKEEIQGTYKY